MMDGETDIFMCVDGILVNCWGLGSSLSDSMQRDVLLYHGWNNNNEPDWNQMNNFLSLVTMHYYQIIVT